MELCVLILAAGKGTRMESDLAKVLHPLFGKPLLFHVLDCVAPLQPARTVAIVGHQAAQVETQVREQYPSVEFALQSEMLGTGHAVQQARETLKNFRGDIVVLCGDAPLQRTETLQKLISARRDNAASASMLVAHAQNPGSYGRVLADENGRVSRIVEAKDATPEELQVDVVNAGTYCFDSEALWRHLAEVKNENASGEFYLTDVIGLMNENGEEVRAVFTSEREMTGVNTRAQLEELEADFAAANK